MSGFEHNESEQQNFDTPAWKVSRIVAPASLVLVLALSFAATASGLGESAHSTIIMLDKVVGKVFDVSLITFIVTSIFRYRAKKKNRLFDYDSYEPKRNSRDIL